MEERGEAVIKASTSKWQSTWTLNNNNNNDADDEKKKTTTAKVSTTKDLQNKS